MNLILLSFYLFICGAFVSLGLARFPKAGRIFSLGCAAVAGGLMFFAAISRLLGADPDVLRLPGPYSISDFLFYLTPFSAFFLALISGLSLVTTVYAFGYHDDKSSFMGAFYNLFLLGMCFLPAARNVFTFLFCWEGMTLASFFLVISGDTAEARKAGYIYLVMSQAGTVFILVSFLLLFHATGSWDFSVFEKSGPHLESYLKNVIFLLAVVGFGVKAGIVPLHLWLPYAHPAAPSHVSALMSGVMIKTAVYGILLTVFSFVGAGTWWWGTVILILGAVSSMLGVLYALMEHDLKRLLAYSSVENMGIIFMGIGAGILFCALGYTSLGYFALAAGLFHTLSHAVFKGLLFLGAGSVIKVTHTHNMEEMGGLAKRMPVASFCFLIGAMSVSALPPLNGFVSEWMTFQSLLSGFGLPFTAVRVLCLLVSAALALTGGLAAACFVKAFGVTFLALPRSEDASHAHDVSVWENSAMIILALSCAALGLFSGAILTVFKPVLGSISPDILTGNMNGYINAGLTGSLISSYGRIWPLAILAVLGSGIVIAWVLAGIVGGPSKIRYGQTWDCGFVKLTSRMEYTATAFAKPFRILFSFLYRPVREIRQECVDGPYFPKSIRYSSKITHLIKEKLYRPPLRFMLNVSHLARRFQAGSVNIYLGYLFATITVLIIVFLMGLMGAKR